MSIKIRATDEEQLAAILHVSQTFDMYKNLLRDYRNRLLEVYKEYSTFKQEKIADWKTTFKVNKAHEVVNKITPRIMSKNPKWLVSNKPDILNDVYKLDNAEEQTKRMDELDIMTVAVQDYLSHIFDKYNLIEPAIMWAKNMVIYGNSFAKIKFKYEMSSTIKPTNKEEAYIDENGEEVIEMKDKEKEEYVWGEHPTIEVKNWSDIFYDPRYTNFDDLPAIIEHQNGVRLADLKRSKEKYINLDKLDDIAQMEAFHNDPE